MKLENIDGTGLELNILGYQFQELKNEPYDSNWLMIKVKVRHPRGDWEATDPSLLTYEVQELAEWLESVGTHKAKKMQLDFIEPNLSFKLSEDCKTLRVFFELELRPSWSHSNVAGLRDLWIDIEVKANELIGAAKDLIKQLSKYPQRARH